MSHRLAPLFLSGVFVLSASVVACSSTETTAAPAPAATTPPGETPDDGTGDGGSEAGNPEKPSTPTAVVATARCDKLAACRPASLKSLYGDLATCRTRMAIEEDYLAALADVTSPTAPWAQGCKEALTKSPCSAEDFTDVENLPVACRLTGTRAKGAKAERASQCKSGLAAECGTCEDPRPAPPIGATCVSFSDCLPELQCKSGTCQALVAENGACAPDDSCAQGLSCANGKCTKPQTTVGAPCMSSEQCDASKSLYCTGASGATPGQCATPTFVGNGETCGKLLKFCLDGDCQRDPFGSSSDKVCFEHLKDGAGCSQSVSNTRHCQSPAKCTGTCTPPSASKSNCN